ncbi:MAG TPA: glycosyltransferase family 2 protein [Acidimicrobiales bacterium]|nr:glycosyltransferase family 2 protein [Acidimicrobiales bacterium]
MGAKAIGSVSVVLPCLDEAESVGRCVAAALEGLAAAGVDGEVVVVDNGSSDGSPQLAADAGARIVHETRRGYGSALRAGFAAANGDVVIMADADLTYDFAKIPELLAPIEAGEADLVLGSRLGSATRETMPFLHRFVGTPAITFLTARACGRRVVKDSQSGYRAFRRDAVQALELQSTGMELASEMLIRAARGGLRITEVETGYGPRVGESKLSTFRDGWRHLQLILLMAPDLLLVGPGAAVCALGALLLGGSFAFPEGVDVGSLRWQPVFFSGIALVVGLQAVLAGAVLAHHSTIAVPGAQRRFAWVGRPDLPVRALATGVAMALAGFALNVVLLVRWLGGNEAPTGRGYGLAALSQSLIILGGTVASFGVVTRFLTSRRGLLPAGSRRAGADRTATSPAADRAPDLSATP